MYKTAGKYAANSDTKPIDLVGKAKVHSKDSIGALVSEISEMETESRMRMQRLRDEMRAEAKMEASRLATPVDVHGALVSDRPSRMLRDLKRKIAREAAANTLLEFAERPGVKPSVDDLEEIAYAEAKIAVESLASALRARMQRR